MTVKIGRATAPTLIAELEKSPQELRETAIEERDDWNPHCVLPENYFEFALHRQGQEGVPLSINTWDGREILSVIRRH